LPTRLRKVRHQRGSRTHGWGTSGQHRASGMRGGFGNAGRYRHKKSRLIKNKEFVHMHYVGKKGFISVPQRQHQGKALNLQQLSAMVDKLVSERKAQMENQKITVDLGELGFKKLLGMGSISRAVRVKVDQCSESALKKLREAGGEALLNTPAK
jgi:large subunit ribosomal protein L15